jgi:hypothetical protein
MFPLAMFLRQKCQREWHVCVTIVLALATLGGITQVGLFLFAKASTIVTVVCCCRWHFRIQTLKMYTSLYWALFAFNTTETRHLWHLKVVISGNIKGGSIAVLLTSCLTGLESAVWLLTIFVFIFQNRLIQTSQTGGQRYSDTPPFSIPPLFSCIGV